MNDRSITIPASSPTCIGEILVACCAVHLGEDIADRDLIALSVAELCRLAAGRGHDWREIVRVAEEAAQTTEAH